MRQYYAAMTNWGRGHVMVAGIPADAGDERKAERAFEILKEIHSISFATINNSRPAVRIIDLMDVEDSTLYFLTARGKPFYTQLKKNPHAAILGLSKDYFMVRIEGKTAFTEDNTLLDQLLEKNRNVAEIYGDKADILDVFCIKSGCGEIFDLSSPVAKRVSFSFGGERCKARRYLITDDCTACGLCIEECPTGAISEGPGGSPYSINPVLCLHCGRCFEICPEDAIVYSEEE